MATSQGYIEFVLEQLQGLLFDIRYRKMFGEYCVYINEKPFVLVCDETVFVPKHEAVAHLLSETGVPYEGAKERFLLDIENRELLHEVIMILEQEIPMPKPKKRKSR